MSKTYLNLFLTIQYLVENIGEASQISCVEQITVDWIHVKDP